MGYKIVCNYFWHLVLVFHSMLGNITPINFLRNSQTNQASQALRSHPHRWIQITDQQQKDTICAHACNPIINEGTSLSPNGQKRIKLTRHDLTHTISYYYVSIRDTKTQDCLLEAEFEHDKKPMLFFTPDNKPVIKLGDILNILDTPYSTVTAFAKLRGLSISRPNSLAT